MGEEGGMRRSKSDEGLRILWLCRAGLCGIVQGDASTLKSKPHVNPTPQPHARRAGYVQSREALLSDRAKGIPLQLLQGSWHWPAYQLQDIWRRIPSEHVVQVGRGLAGATGSGACKHANRRFASPWRCACARLILKAGGTGCALVHGLDVV